MSRIREIKFRAWHKDAKKMVKLGQITLEKGTWNYEPEDREYIGMSIPYQPSFIVMKYIGLNDKSGKEIYEGDIVKIDCPTMKMQGKVFYDENGADFRIYDELEDIEECLWYLQEEYEVIGNIYENPELLEKGKEYGKF